MKFYFIFHHSWTEFEGIVIKSLESSKFFRTYWKLQALVKTFTKSQFCQTCFA